MMDTGNDCEEVFIQGSCAGSDARNIGCWATASEGRRVLLSKQARLAVPPSGARRHGGRSAVRGEAKRLTRLINGSVFGKGGGQKPVSRGADYVDVL